MQVTDREGNDARQPASCVELFDAAVENDTGSAIGEVTTNVDGVRSSPEAGRRAGVPR